MRRPDPERHSKRPQVAAGPSREQEAEPVERPLPDLTLPALALAPLLLGCLLVRTDERGRRRSGVIVETEAYPGGADRASHTFGGRATQRNASMWRRGGHAYVYFTYGMHHCLNVVSGPEGSGEAVLLRALEPFEGIAAMAAVRPNSSLRDLCRGPGRLCAALEVDRRLDGCKLLRVSSGETLGKPATARLTLEPRRRPVERIAVGPRIGIGSALEWAAMPWRFVVAGSRFVSGRA